MAIEWTDELREKVKADYLAKEPTADTSVEIVANIAKEIGATPNGVRAILSAAKIYIKKTPATGTSTSTDGAKPASTRVNKADAVAGLKAIIEAQELPYDEDIIGKLTGKAAIYFTGILTAATSTESE